jgi:hypothetical protein
VCPRISRNNLFRQKIFQTWLVQLDWAEPLQTNIFYVGVKRQVDCSAAEDDKDGAIDGISEET